MKAIVYTQHGQPEVLRTVEVEKPKPKDDQVLIRVRASSINVTEYQLFNEAVSGERPGAFMNMMTTFVLKPVGNILGGEASGIVESVGKNVKRVKPGDEVFGMTADIRGAWAEYVCADESMVYTKPSNISFEEAAVIPTTGATALSAVRKAGIKEGDEVLVYGASGGVGLFAVQLAKAAGGIVTGICSTRNIELVRSVGADYMIDYQKEDVRKNGKKYDAIIAINGYNSIFTYKKMLKSHGSYIAIGGVKQGIEAMFGPIVSLGSNKTMGFAAYGDIKGKAFHYLDYIKETVEKGNLKPFIDKTYPVQDVAEGIRYMITDHARGKVAVSVDFNK